jgi:hypothetical protein
MITPVVAESLFHPQKNPLSSSRYPRCYTRCTAAAFSLPAPFRPAVSDVGKAPMVTSLQVRSPKNQKRNEKKHTPQKNTKPKKKEIHTQTMKPNIYIYK